MLDRFPTTKDEEAKDVAKLLWAFQHSDNARRPLEDKCLRWYAINQNYVEAEDKNEDNWRSKVGIPAIFYVIETVAPRLVAQLPEPLVKPMRGADVNGARVLKDTLDWSADVSGLYIQLVAQIRDALSYGTGIMKTFADEKTAVEMIRQEIMQDVIVPMPVMDPETMQPLPSVDGAPVMEERSIGQIGTGQYEMVTKPYTYYRGPVGEAVDWFNFWPDPEATSMDDARWVIQRSFISREEFEKLVSEGGYRKPDYMTDGDFYAQVEDPKWRKKNAVGEGGPGGTPIDPQFGLIELLEFWSKGPGGSRKACLANRRAIVSAEANPFNHGELPYTRIVDHFKQHEFYGTGEIQMLEGIQDEINVLTNSRIDAVKLAMHLMFFVDEDALVDTSDLRVRPGGRVRVRNRYGLPLDQIIKKIEFGDVTNSSYLEVQEAMEGIERFSGVAGPPGPEDAGRYRTATGVMSIDEGMASRFAHKLKMMELTGMQRLFKHFGILLQQFTDEEISRQVWKDGEWDEVVVTPEAIQGRFEYAIKAESSALSLTNRRNEADALYQGLGQDPYINPIAPRENLLKEYGIKDFENWLASPEQQLMLLLQQMPPEQVQQIMMQMMQQAQMQEQPQEAPVG